MSQVNELIRREKPMSGLNAQRLVPRLINRAGSYCPSGGITCRLAPSTVRGGWAMYWAYAFRSPAGAPRKFTATLNRGAVRPRMLREAGSPTTRAVPDRCDIGRIISNRPELPRRSIERAYASAVVWIWRWA